MYQQRDLNISTRGRATYDITAQVLEVVQASGLRRGLCTIFVHHTSASLVICENADPQVLRDLEAFLARWVPDGDKLFKHTDEGNDDMPAHVRSTMTQTSITVPVADGRLDLGVWQGLYLYEHRHAPHARRVSVTLMGEA